MSQDSRYAGTDAAREQANLVAEVFTAIWDKHGGPVVLAAADGGDYPAELWAGWPEPTCLGYRCRRKPAVPAATWPTAARCGGPRDGPDVRCQSGKPPSPAGCCTRPA